MSKRTKDLNTTHIRPSHSLTFGVYRALGGLYARAYVGYRSKPAPKKQSTGLLILCNSQTLHDSLFVRLAFDHPVYCVQTRTHRRGPIESLADLLTAPIWQKPSMQTWSASAVHDITEIIHQGGSVCLFPCGAPAYGFAPNPPSKQTVALVRALNVPVVLYTLHGGPGALPRWSETARKGPFIGRCERTLMPEEYAEMSDDELYGCIRQTLCIHDKHLGLTYASRHRAERLERVLYVCPRCHEHSKLYSSGNHISCRGCGMTANYTEAGDFVFLNCETPISNLDAWLDYQLSWLKIHKDDFGNEIYTDQGVTIFSVDKTPADEPLFGTLILTREKLLLRFEDGEAGTRTVGFALDSVASLKVCGKVKLSLTNAQGTWEITGAPNFCSYKYAQMFLALRGQYKK